jgi:hypothetical protein
VFDKGAAAGLVAAFLLILGCAHLEAENPDPYSSAGVTCTVNFVLMLR